VAVDPSVRVTIIAVAAVAGIWKPSFANKRRVPVGTRRFTQASS
jgi:hypothetical protein